MICFPNGKINLGLHVLSKRTDGFHNIESLIYPIPLRDALEFLPAHSFQLTFSGFPIDGNPEDNLVYRAWKVLNEKFGIPPLHIHLHKAIPIASGLGGGSADAAFFLRAANDFFKLAINREQMSKIAGRLGSDCPFFMANQPAFVSGKGNLLEFTDFSLAGKFLVIVQTDIRISTQEAYRMVKPEQPETQLPQMMMKAPEQWKTQLKNDFEEVVFSLHPELENLKKYLYQNGAFYAAMSGSGAALFGLFNNKPDFTNINPNYYFWFGKL